MTEMQDFFKDKKSIVVFVIGRGGSGKSSFIREINQQLGYGIKYWYNARIIIKDKETKQLMIGEKSLKSILQKAEKKKGLTLIEANGFRLYVHLVDYPYMVISFELEYEEWKRRYHLSAKKKWKRWRTKREECYPLNSSDGYSDWIRVDAKEVKKKMREDSLFISINNSEDERRTTCILVNFEKEVLK